jgi:NADH-quinone oxidoreductase subunit A
MLPEYGYIFLHLVVAVGFAAIALLISVWLGKSGARNKTKDSAYECGMLPEGPSQPRFSVKFYLVAMLFILFDLEIVFMYPWAVVFKKMIHNSPLLFNLPLVFTSMLGFILILLVGYIYALRKGALDWKH